MLGEHGAVAKPIKHYGKWRVRWIDAGGKRRSATFDTYKEAEQALRRQQVEADEIRDGVRRPVQPDRTFGDLADYWLEHRAPHKRSAKDDESMIRRYLRPTFGHLRLADVTVQRVDAFRAGLDLSDKTVHNILTLLVAMLNLAVELEWIARAPRIRKPRIRHGGRDFNYLRTDDDIARFLRAARAEGELVFVLYATATYTGMRAGELAGLRWACVDLDRRLITVERSYTGPTKAGDVRYVPILDPLLPVLREWRLRCPGELVFPNQAGNMHGPSARVFQEILRRVLDRAGFPKENRRGREHRIITFHGLRHTFASHWMMKGGDIFKLQRIGGWKSFAMVQRYAHLAPDAFAADYGRFGTAAPAAAPSVVPLASTR